MIRFTLTTLIPLSFILFASLSYTQTFAPAAFYLVDSLNLNELSSQEKRTIDSCLTFYHNTDNDTSKINTLFFIYDPISNDIGLKYAHKQLAVIKSRLDENPPSREFMWLVKMTGRTYDRIAQFYYTNNNLPKTLQYTFKNLKTMKAIKNKEEMANCFLHIGFIYLLQNNPKSLAYSKKALKLFNEMKDYKKSIICLENIGLMHHQSGNFYSSIDSYNQSLDLNRAFKDTNKVFRLLINIGSLYAELSSHGIALEYFYEALSLSIQTKNRANIAMTLNNIGLVYYDRGDQEKGIKCFLRSLTMAKELKNYPSMISCYQNLGRFAHDQKNYKSALNFFYNAMRLNDKYDSPYEAISILINMSNTHSTLGNFSEAIKLAKISLKTSENIGSKFHTCRSLIRLGSIFFEQEKWSNAVFYFKQSLELAMTHNFPAEITYASEHLSKVYEELSLNEKALKMFQLHSYTKDSINNQKTEERITKLETKHKLEKRDKEILLLNKEKKLKDAQFIISLFLYGIVLFSLITIAFLWNKRKKNYYEKELNNLRQLLVEKKKDKNILSIPVCVGKKIFSVKMDNICFFKGESKYVFLNTADGKSFIVDYTLSSLEKTLPKNFTRIHRSIIINDQHIHEIKKANRRRVTVTMNNSSQTSFTSTAGYITEAENLVKNHYPS